MRLVTCLLYWIVVTPAGMLNRILGRDPLLLRNTSAASTYWMPLSPGGGPLDYLTPADRSNSPAGVARWLLPIFGLFARRPQTDGRAAAEVRSQDIPDEIYTLW